MCGYVSKSRMCLYSHMKVDERSGVRHYSCCICRLPTLSKYFILKHVASHVKSGNSRCLETGEDKCGDVKSCGFCAWQQLWYSSCLKFLTCLPCWTGTRSAVKPSYRRCPRCCCIAGSQACIRQHVFTSADDDATVYSCRLCEFTWTRLSAIRRHVTSHIQDVSDCDSSRAGGTGEDNSTDTLDSGEIVCHSKFWCHCRSVDAWWAVLMMFQPLEWRSHMTMTQILIEMIGSWSISSTL